MQSPYWINWRATRLSNRQWSSLYLQNDIVGGRGSHRIHLLHDLQCSSRIESTSCIDSISLLVLLFRVILLESRRFGSQSQCLPRGCLHSRFAGKAAQFGVFASSCLCPLCLRHEQLPSCRNPPPILVVLQQPHPRSSLHHPIGAIGAPPPDPPLFPSALSNR